MPLHNILNTAVATIQTCESEPIHIPGSIQPHGCLLAASLATGRVTHCSANTEQFFGLPPEAVLQSDLPTLLPGHHLGADQQDVEKVELNRLACNLRRQPVGGDVVIIELEPCGSELRSGEVYQQMRSFVASIDSSGSLQALCQAIAEETRGVTGFDRVMVYRFDPDYNGEVYAESKADDLQPLLGLHYPHTDIPAQARDLYLRSLLRLIPDVDYTPVPVLTLGPAGPDSLDLSEAHLRSVSPIHIQYLKNMGVGATLTLSLLLDGRLWGLIACHHRVPRWLSHEQRQSALLQAHFLSSQIRVRQAAEEYAVNISVDAHLQLLLNRLQTDEDLAMKLHSFSALPAVANASGAVVIHKGILYPSGITPPPERVRSLLSWLEKSVRGNSFTTTHLSQRFGEAVSIARTASGILYHSLGRPTEEAVIWFRPEVEQTVRWAGNPHEAVQQDPQTKSLTPRASFAEWKERVRYQALPWRVSEVNAAARLAAGLQHYFHLQQLQEEDLRLRMLNDKLQRANSELANINWITTHDLKEPLRKIQLFAHRIMDEEQASVSQSLRQAVERIQRSALRMQHLVDDILTYSTLSAGQNMPQELDLKMLLAEVAEELSDDLAEAGGGIEWGDLPSRVYGIPPQIRQLLLNLLQNSIKFRSPGRALRVMVSGAAVERNGTAFHELTIRDNGIGFDQVHGPRLFEIFFRLHSVEDYSGTGIGLAICQKIAEAHGGFITAEGAPGAGAVFRVYLRTSAS